MMERKCTDKREVIPKHEPIAADTRPESSPYASPVMTLHFQNGSPLAIPMGLIRSRPKLSSSCEYDMTLRLPHVSGDAGHVLIHYLFTRTYECLRPRGSDCLKQHTAELTTASQVYAVAREYCLPSLAGLALGKIERLGNRLQLVQVLDVLKDTLSSLDVDDMQLQSYLKSLVRPAFDAPPISSNDLPHSPGKPLSIIGALLKVTAELWHEKTPLFTSKPHDLGIGQDGHEEPSKALVETGLAVNLEDSPEEARESICEDEACDSKPKNAKNEKKKTGKKGKKKEANTWDCATEEQVSWMESEGWQFNMEKPLNSKDRRRLRRMQRNEIAEGQEEPKATYTLGGNGAAPTSQPELPFGSGLGTPIF
ncbi:hypothetical protein F5Y16DRAFT_392926 [Xylariaceae sp. FL0255]|nr:hypothetical protein F5Y16DRAFT_392926 [Xylariaceae sp. FL0255]